MFRSREFFICCRLLHLLLLLNPIIDELQEDDKENDDQDFDRHGSQIPTGHCGRLVDYTALHGGALYTLKEGRA